MIQLKNIVYRLIPIQKQKPLTPLGRWGIDQSCININNKVEWSNEDHCGPCGQYRLKVKESNPKPPPTTNVKDKSI